MPAEGSVEEEVPRVGGTVAGRCQTSPHSAPHYARNSGAVTGAGGWDASHVRCAAWWLTPTAVV